MNFEIFVMNGFGIYVWSSFAFTFLVCLFLFLRTKKTLKKLEKEFVKEASLTNSFSNFLRVFFVLRNKNKQTKNVKAKEDHT